MHYDQKHSHLSADYKIFVFVLVVTALKCSYYDLTYLQKDYKYCSGYCCVTGGCCYSSYYREYYVYTTYHASM